MHRLTLAVVLVALGAAPAHAGDTLRVGKASPTAFAMLPAVVAAEEGFFKNHGIDVQILDFGGGAKMHQAMAAGSLDIGIGSGAELAMVAKGSPELAICNAAGPPLFIAIAVPFDSPAHRAEDLKGKKIGVSSPNSMTYWMALQLAKHYGWGEDGITIVTLGGDTAAIIAAFKTHLVDADIGGSAVAFSMAEQKVGRFLIPVSDYLGNMSSDTVFASKKLIAEHPDDVRAFLAGWFDGVDFMRKHKAETVKIAQKMTGLDDKVQSREYDQSIPMFSNDGKFDEQSLATLKQSFIDLKLLDTVPDLRTTFTEAYLPKR